MSCRHEPSLLTRRTLERRRGVALGLVITVALLSLVIIMTVSSVGTAQLNFTQLYVGGLDAQYLAESAISHAIMKIHDDSTYGTKGTEQIVVQPDANEPRRKATITFSKTAGRPYSTNNLAEQWAVPVPGWGGASVPVGTVRLLAIGTSRGVTRTVETVIALTPFPYAIACDGPIQSNGSLQVQGSRSVIDVIDLEQGSTRIMPPASLACNSSVTAATTANVTGDLVAAGTVTLPAGSTVGGMIRNGTVDLPAIDISQWDPTSKTGALANPDLSEAVAGLNYTTGDVVYTGDVLLAGGLLYVKGNLTINGGLTGSGAIVVTGTTTINGGTDLSALNLVALVSGGDIHINGDSTTRKYLQGMVYTRGTLNASNITVAGTLITGGGGASTPGSGGGMTLSNVTAYYSPDAVQANFTHHAVGYGTTSTISGAPLAVYTVSGAIDVHPTAQTPDIGLFLAWVGKSRWQYDLGTGFRATAKVPARQYCHIKDATGRYGSGGAIDTFADGLGRWIRTSPWFCVNDAEAGIWTSGCLYLFTAHKVYANATGTHFDEFPDPYIDYTHRCDQTPAPTVNGVGTGQAQMYATYGKTDVDNTVSYCLGRQTTWAKVVNRVLALPSSSLDFSCNNFIRDTAPFRIYSWKVY